MTLDTDAIRKRAVDAFDTQKARLLLESFEEDLEAVPKLNGA